MDSYSIRYRFSQSFDFPAKAAFDWCTDYRPDDLARMGKKGARRIERINEDTLILADTYASDDGSVTKRRLVRLHPGRLAWTNTHLTGPNKHSQFWYQIVSRGSGKSRLEFTALQVNYGKRPPPARIAGMAEELRADDAGAWSLLAKEMRKDLRKQKR